MSNDAERSQWLKDSEEYFRQVQSYNSTIITVGYATFFAALFFLVDKSKATPPAVYAALLCLVFSAVIFVVYELWAQVKTAIEASRLGQEGGRPFRLWAAFFVPSLLLGVSGVGLLVYLILCEL